MRKLLIKKGFTLVELMIVVVILGILVAIAVPIYSAVTANAKKKACKSDSRIIRSNLATYLLTGDSGGTAYTGGTAALAGDSLYANSSFAAMFDNAIVPQCPNSKTNYVVAFQSADKFTVTCAAADTDDCPAKGFSTAD